MKILSIVLFTVSLAFISSAQDTKIVFLKEGSKQVQTIDYSQFVSPRAIARRERQGIGYDELDAPVNKEILSLLSSEGELKNVSRWLNAVALITFSSVDQLMAKYDFIERIQVVKHSKSSTDKFANETKSLNYGMAIDQVEQLNLDCLHDLGFTGAGIYVGVIDAGFRNMDTIAYFDSVYIENRVLDEYNFVDNNATVYGFSGHGTAVSSCIAGEKLAPAEYAGTGVDVDLALYLSEDVGSETEIEEFYLVTALERADSVGIDVVNISLGYFEYDDSLETHLYSDLDGLSTISAVGVNIAATKGIFVANSAGNSGPSNISTPCDAIGSFCVGAVNEVGDLAGFSSLGPAADGRVKPDVVARGRDTWLIGQSGQLGQSNGTSFSSPVLAGATACLIQANPNRTVQEVMDAIRASSSQFNNPDEFKGYGIPDFCIANDILSAANGLNEFNEENLLIYPVPAGEVVFISGLPSSNSDVSISVYNNLGELVLSEIVSAANAQVELNINELSHGLYNLFLSQDNIQVRRSISVIK